MLQDPLFHPSCEEVCAWDGGEGGIEELANEWGHLIMCCCLVERLNQFYCLLKMSGCSESAGEGGNERKEWGGGEMRKS